jgi:hypothetical protein
MPTPPSFDFLSQEDDSSEPYKQQQKRRQMPTIVGQNFFPRDFFSSMPPLERGGDRPLIKMRTLPARPHSQLPTHKTVRRRILDQSYFGETPKPAEYRKLVEVQTLRSQKLLQPVSMKTALEQQVPNNNPFS